MPMRHAGIGAAVLLASAWSSSATAAVDSSIEAVTIYPGGLARVERVAQIDADERTNDVVFDGLPASIVDDSVRLAVVDGTAKLGSVEITREPVGEPPRERERVLEQRLDELQAKRQAALDRAQAAQHELTFIEGLANLPQGKGAAKALTANQGERDWPQLWQRIGAGARAAHKRLRKSQREADELKRQIKTVKRKIEELGQDRPDKVRVTTAYSDARGTVALRLTYRIKGSAQWKPTYTARLDTRAGRVTLERKAVVKQSSGEAWNDVKLKLSTVEPVSGDRPRPSPWWIELAPKIEGQGVTTSEAADYAAGTASADQQRAKHKVTTEHAEFAATYAVSGRVTIPANNEARTLTIGTEQLDATIGAVVFPQKDPSAWLTAKATWQGPGPLPAGSLARYRDGAYVGESKLTSWSPGAERKMDFGVDRRVVVEYNPLRDQSGDAGWFTSDTQRARLYKLTVTNRHDRPMPLTTLFRVPVPRNEAITVESRFSVQPDERDYNDKTGVNAWRTEIAAGASTSYEFGYRVRYPSDRRVRGLD